jgi:TolB-like protein
MTTAVTSFAGPSNISDVPDREEIVRDQIEQALERVLRSGRFRKCTQLSRFLRFAVAQALAGQNGASKETLIGVEIFRRPPDYDPGADPVVRVEARRLRHKLAEYYVNEGRDDAIRIELPKGGYLPVFEVRSTAAQARSIAVLPFADRSADSTLEALSDGLTVRLIAKLAAFGMLRLVSSTSVFRFKRRTEDPRRIGAELNAELILEGSLRKAGTRFRCDTQLISSSDGLHLWAGSFDCGQRDVFAVEDAFAGSIADGVNHAVMR